jgi:hypothetical protein
VNETEFLEAEMRLSWAAAATAAIILSGITPGTVRAEQPIDEDNDLTIGIGIICNTPEQMLRLIGLRNTGAQAERAVKVVNTEAKDPRACGVAAVAYVTGKMVDMKNVQGKLVQIVRIDVVAAFNGQNWARIPAMTQYALIEPQGYEI